MESDDGVEEIIKGVEGVNITSPSPTSHAPVVEQKKQRLIVLDLNGLLLYRHFADTPPKALNPTRVGQFYAWKRPYADEFISFLMQHFRVAIWSSAMEHNVTALVKWMLPQEEDQKKLLFQWHQEHCVKVPHPDEKFRGKKPLFKKPLSKVWLKYEEYGRDDVLLVDDSKLKAADNPDGTLLCCPEWDVTQCSNNIDDPHNAALKPPNGYIWKFFLDLSQHPEKSLLEATKSFRPE